MLNEDEIKKVYELIKNADEKQLYNLQKSIKFGIDKIEQGNY